MPSSHLILCHPFLLLPSIFHSIRIFSSELALCIRWPKYWSFSISLSNEYSGLISFRTDWFDLLAVQGTFKSFFQHHSSKAPILWCPAFFIVQLSHPHMTIGKTIALTRWTFVAKVMSLLFNQLFRLVITFLPRSKSLLISWLQSPSAVILEPRKIKSATISTVSPTKIDAHTWSCKQIAILTALLTHVCVQTAHQKASCRLTRCIVKSSSFNHIWVYKRLQQKVTKLLLHRRGMMNLSDCLPSSICPQCCVQVEEERWERC